MKKLLRFLSFLLLFNTLNAQQNITLPARVDSVLKGFYDPQQYVPSVRIEERTAVIEGIIDDISIDTLLKNLKKLESFHNRNTASDTVSDMRGIGAARRWIRQSMNTYSAVNENRLITGYLDFDVNVCGVGHHRNVFGILPGLDTSKKEVLLIEAHMDSRCENSCDTSCYAPGVDDNGSGTVLVMELARVMSRYAFDRTIIFTTVTGEEQGLWGGSAWALYLSQHNIPLLACFNNDVVGGVICGHTSSPPGCSPEGDVDSTSLRIFSYTPSYDTGSYSTHRQLARYVKLQQIEEINPRIAVPMNIQLEVREDRAGRGGDHIPFRREGLTALRFTAHNEHGDGSGTPPDHQHTTNDILGVDTDMPPDGMIDSFFVDLNYLRRNAITNGVNLGLLASSPHPPAWSLRQVVGDEKSLGVNINDTRYNEYRVAVRSLGSGTLYFDTVYEVKNSKDFDFPVPLSANTTHYISVASVEGGIESVFAEEQESLPTGIPAILSAEGYKMFIYPNPGSRVVRIRLDSPGASQGVAFLRFYDLNGKVVLEKPFHSGSASHEQEVDVSVLGAGTYYCVFHRDGRELAGSRLVLMEP